MLEREPRTSLLKINLDVHFKLGFYHFTWWCRAPDRAVPRRPTHFLFSLGHSIEQESQFNNFLNGSNISTVKLLHVGR